MLTAPHSPSVPAVVAPTSDHGSPVWQSSAPFLTAVGVELLKMRRAPVITTLIVGTSVPCGMSLFGASFTRAP